MNDLTQETPAGVRLEVDEPQFKTRSTDPLIEPDRVSPTIEGYFRIPAVWIGDPPAPETIRVLNPNIHHAKVFTANLKCGINVVVQRDGLFLFDFSHWPLAPMVIIPGFRKPNENGPYRYPVEHGRAEQQAEEYAVLRAQVMNVHQACLTTAELVVKHRGAAMGFPVTAWNTHKAISFDVPPAYHDDSENLHALGHNILNNKDGIRRRHILNRRALELDVVRHSFQLLDDILLHDDSKLIHIVEAAYIAACRSSEKRFGEALTLAWGACEQLVSSEWHRFLDNHAKKDLENMPRERRKKLAGRDYTASIMIEMLEVSGLIDRDLYRQLEIARKARNYWVHEMRSPKQCEVYVCLQAVEALLLKTKKIRIRLQLSGRGGVPQWPYWLWNQLRRSNNS